MFAHEFVRNAYLAGTFVALACGCAGWFVILRGQLFAGDALSHVAFVGAIAAGVLGLDMVIGIAAAFRPLLLSTLDPELAVIRGVPVRLLGVAFLVVLAVVSAESTQAVGALLLLGLLAAPAGAAHRLTTDPRRGLLLSAVFSVGSIWIGLTLSYVFPTLPPSSMVIAAAAAIYALPLAVTTGREPRAGW